MDYEKIGKFIQEKRKEKKLTQRALADAIGVTDKAVSKWERGMGCPDISIIEILSKTLDTSILEILKGEEIKESKADDDVKYALNYSCNSQKEERKKNIENFVIFMIVVISLVLVCLNIESIVRLNEEYTSNLVIDNSLLKNYDKVMKNISVIKSNQGIFNNSDYQTILEDLKNIENYLNYNKILHTDNQIKLTKEELFMCYSNAYYGYITLSIVKRYNNNFDYTNYINIFDFGKSVIYEKKLLNSYKYKYVIDNYYDEDDISYDADDAIMRTEISVEKYLNLTNLIIKVGELNA